MMTPMTLFLKTCATELIKSKPSLIEQPSLVRKHSSSAEYWGTQRYGFAELGLCFKWGTARVLVPECRPNLSGQ